MGALDKMISLTFSTMLSKPFTEWKAFKLGLIDEKGNKLHDPKTKEEKSALTTMINLVRKVKRTLVKFTPDTPTVQFLLATYLLKEDAKHEANEGVMELIESFTEIEKHYFNIYLKGYGL